MSRDNKIESPGQSGQEKQSDDAVSFDNAGESGPNDVDDFEPQKLERAAETLRVLAHPHRLRMLSRLARGTRTVSWLAEDCGIRNHTASEHLRLMQKLEFVKGQRQGRYTHYRLRGLAGRQLIEMVECWLEAGPSDRETELREPE